MSDLETGPAVGDSAREAWARHLGHPPGDDLRERLAAGSLAELAHATALADPQRPAVQVDGASLTHGALDERAGLVAGWLRGGGVSLGDVVLVSGPSSLMFVVAYLGVLRAGATVVLANPAYTEVELGTLLADSGAVLALGTGSGLERLRAAAARTPRVPTVRSLEELDGDELAGGPALEPAPREPGTPAILAYTSGTTGRPKAVPLTDANLLSSIRAAMLAWRWEPDDVLVHALPLFHQHGLSGVHAALVSGSRVVIRSRFDPGDLCEAIDGARATVLFAVPTIYAQLAGWEGIADAGLGGLRLLVSGSAPLSPAIANRIGDLAGQPPLERYGTTESGLDMSNLYDGPRRPGLVGLALPGVELAIAGEDGAPLPHDADGEILLRGPQVFGGYRNDSAASERAFRPGGWFRTGDVGRIDADDGFVQITGRLSELIISGGMNVYPREVELALEEHPAVARAAVVGVPSERWGEEVAAAIVASSGVPHAPPDDELLLGFARSRLAPYKCPKRLVFVSELPVNPMGKVIAAEVRKLF